MKKDSTQSIILFYAVSIILVALSRYLPHPYNFSPLTAVGIFLGTQRSVREGVGFVLFVRFITDAVLGFYQIQLMVAVYVAHLLGVGLGYWIRKTKNKVVPVILAPLISAGLFFLITNFAFLYPEYGHDLAGIMKSYALALPYFSGTLYGDVFYTYALFGGYALIRAYSKSTSSKLRNDLSL